MTRKATWSNSDGLVIGFGANTPERSAAGTKKDVGGVKEATIFFDYTQVNTSASGSINWTAPAGTNVVGVALDVEVAFLGGTSLEFGDATDTDGFITASQGATANLTAGAHIVGSGVYTKGATDAVAQEFKSYASATVLSLLRAGTFTQGKGSLKISYL